MISFSLKMVLVVSCPLLLTLSTFFAYSGESPHPGRKRGFLIDQRSYSTVPLVAPLMRGAVHDSLPSRFSLKRYMPTPGDQGDHPTNAAWAVAYSAYTCMKAIDRNTSDQASINAMAFSPGYLYAVTLGEAVLNCEQGIDLTQALDALTSRGIVTLREFPGECDRVAPEGLKEVAGQNRISAYRRLFSDQMTDKGRPIKVSLAGRKPVVAAMWYVRSFDDADEKWAPEKEESYRSFGDRDSGIAVTVVGYDDSRFGGAFEVMNSAGTSWGEDGFCWIAYDVFNRFCVQAFEMIVDPSVGPSDEVHLPEAILPANPADATIAGSVNFIDLYQRQLNVSRDGEIYRLNRSDITGSSFRIQIGTTTGGFIYVIVSDGQSQLATTIFPDARFGQSERVIPGGQVVIPPLGSGYIQIDTSSGVDHFCFLFSIKPVDIADLVGRIDGGKGVFMERVQAALSGALVNSRDITLSDYGSPSFWTAERNRNVVALFVDLQHQRP